MQENNLIELLVIRLGTEEIKNKTLILDILTKIVKAGEEMKENGVNLWFNRMQSYGGVAAIESLQQCQSEEVSNKAVGFLQKFC